MTTPSRPSATSEIPLIDRLRAATAGRYDIHSELGAGGMATVFRATEIALEREVAIKVMSSSVATTPGAFERFRREALVAAALSHAHIVPIYAIGEDPAVPYFAMKFIEGRGLEDILQKDGARPLEDVVRTIGVVGRALHHAHQKGVVHRDVKPANIMIGKDGWIFVTDFGIAKRDDREGLTQAGTVIGTPAYMSPEQFNGLPITGAADQYSLGIVAYEMLAGRAPFDGPSLGEIMRGHLLEAPPALRTRRIDVPTGVAECVNRMLEKEPSQRFASLAEAVDEFEAAASVAITVDRRSAGSRTSAAAGARASAGMAPRVSADAPTRPSTPILPPRTAANSGSVRRQSTGPRPVVVAEPPAGGTSIVGVLLGLIVIAAGGWYLLQDRPATAPDGVALSSTARPSEGALPVDGAIAAESLAAESLAAESLAAQSLAAVTPAATGRQAIPASLDSAFSEIQTRIAAEPGVDAIAPPDSVVVRIGSQTLETVLFVNDRQLGIVGGRGLVESTVPPGAISLSVRRINCRNWDTTFTSLPGRRYTFVERSPTC